MSYRFSIFLAAVLILIFAGCGSDEPTPSPTATPAPAATSTPIPATPTPPPLDVMDALMQTDDFTILNLMLGDAGLADKLHNEGPFTLFAPTNAAFAELPDAIKNDADALFDLMLYIVVDGAIAPDALAQTHALTPLLGDNTPLAISNADGAIDINEARVIGPPILAQNGIIYPIDKVLVPPTISVLAVQSSAPVANAVLPNLLQIAESAGDLTTFLDGLQAAGLFDILSADTPHTLFAPTDRAFDQLVENASGELLQKLDEDPAPLLKYHMIAGYLATASIQDGLTLETLAGAPLLFSAQPDGDKLQLTVNNGQTSSATIVSQELAARNGVIHVIDAVLLPPVPFQ
ncbi:MAG: fasciclin domain-containing protein [Caldilineaceae bacterium]